MQFEQRLDKFKRAVADAEAILIGGGAGLSAAAGLTYSGKRFEHHFAEYIARYQLTDMYSSGFYPFPSEQAKWAYWSRHIALNRYQTGPTQLYQLLYSMVKDKRHFVITTNADHQFYKAGFSLQAIFATQGDYGLFQCARPCHKQLYDNEQLVATMVARQDNCLIASELVPRCPVCGGRMTVNIRIDASFVEDIEWQAANERYQQFVEASLNKRLLLLEMGVGYNTPSIIKYPFEQITIHYPGATLVRFNRDYPEIGKGNEDKTLLFNEDIAAVIPRLIAATA